MCGVVGIFNLKSNPPVEPSVLKSMLGAIRHRGPDQYGTYIFRDHQTSVGLGSARLSIIDIASGQQPLSNEDGTIWIVFNGEIFNYIELIPEVERLGHHMETDCDTEVIVHLYEEYGPDCLDHLNGQFVIIIWDEREKQLLIARDRLGIRPLYYTMRDDRLYFASEVKALLAHPEFQVELDPITLDQIFTFWSPLSPRSIFKDIQTLPPGHYLVARPDSDLRIEPYWQLSFPDDKDKHVPVESADDIEDLARQLRELLVEATTIRLRADVPVGAYLSGGLDSSTITALIHKYTSNRLETFSIAFTDEAYDESAFQWKMADYLGTEHHLITCTHADIGRIFPDVIWHTETPIMRTSPAPLYLLSQMVNDHNFKVVLTGEGADEFLAGYNIFKEAKIRRFWARQPDSECRPALLQKLYPYISDLGSGNDAYLQRFFGQGLSDIEDPYYSHAIRWRNNRRTKRIFSREIRLALEGMVEDGYARVDLPSNFSQYSPLAQAQFLEINVFLSQYLLSSQGDRVAMSHSVEGRFPFLDHNVVEFCNHLPPQMKLRGLTEKYLLKQAVRDLLPEAVWQRPKRPYRAPIFRSFFPEGRPVEWVSELLSPDRLAQTGYFDPEVVAGLVNKISRVGALGETDDMMLAGLLSTELVHELFVTSYRGASPIGEGDDLKEVVRVGEPVKH